MTLGGGSLCTWFLALFAMRLFRFASLLLFPLRLFRFAFLLCPVIHACTQIQGKFDSINSQLNNAREVYRDGDGDHDLGIAAAEAAAEMEVSEVVATKRMEMGGLNSDAWRVLKDIGDVLTSR